MRAATECARLSLYAAAAGPGVELPSSRRQVRRHAVMLPSTTLPIIQTTQTTKTKLNSNKRVDPVNQRIKLRLFQ